MAEDSEQREGRGFPLKFLFSGVKLPFLLILVLVVGAVGGTAYLIKQRPDILGLSTANQAEAEAARILREIGALMTLPEGENPTIATVTDVEKLKEQQFFRNAQNGDKVLIYPNSRRVILYRSSEKRIIEVGAVNINQQATPAPDGEENLEELDAEVEETEAPEPTQTPEPTETSEEE